MDLSAAQQAIATYGYGALFLGVLLLEGETFLLLAAMAAREGIFTPGATAAIAVAAAIMGDHLFYILGRWCGPWLMRHTPGLRRLERPALGIVQRNQVGLLLSSHFLYGMRVPLLMAFATAGISWPRFTLYNSVSGLVWVVVFGILGYYAADWVFAGGRGTAWLPRMALVISTAVVGLLVGVHLLRRILGLVATGRLGWGRRNSSEPS